MGAMNTTEEDKAESDNASNGSSAFACIDCYPVLRDTSACMGFGAEGPRKPKRFGSLGSEAKAKIRTQKEPVQKTGEFNPRNQASNRTPVLVRHSLSDLRPSSAKTNKIENINSLCTAGQQSELLESRSAQLVRGKSLSFSGKIPADWDKAQLERLEWAVQEIARRSQLRAPGPRSMHSVMEARARGDRDAASTNYDLR